MTDVRIRHVLAAVAVVIVLPIGVTYCTMAQNVATAPARVINRTLGTDNILQNYEWFFDINAQYQARTAQIASQKRYLADETDAVERRRLRMELAAMQQSCRDLATQYNANSIKQNRSLFKDRGLPGELACAE